MQDNKELFKHLNIEENSAAAGGLDKLSGAVNRHLAKQAGPSQKVIDNIMAAAEAKKGNAIKRFAFPFSYKAMAAGVLIVLLMFAALPAVFKSKVVDTEIYSYATDYNFELLDEELEDLLSEIRGI